MSRFAVTPDKHYCKMKTLEDPRSYTSVPRIGVGVVILLNGRLVLVQRQKPPARNKWTLPGGMIELGERAVDAAIREAREETGLDIRIDSLLEAIDYIRNDAQGMLKYHYVLLDYLAYAVGGSLQPGSDARALKLVTAEDLDALDMPEMTRSFIAKHVEELL